MSIEGVGKRGREGDGEGKKRPAEYHREEASAHC
jgi:hypothetical protein